MKDKIVVISGSTSGIGKFTALKLAAEGARLILLARNMTRAQSVVEEIKKKTGNNNIDQYIADLSVMDEIRKTGKKISDKYPSIDILINCAGMIFPKRYESADGIELTFALNHLGYFLLTKMLLPNLEKAPAARIINVASQAQRAGSINFDNINLNEGYTAFKAYSQSKLANIMFTYELARKLEGTNVTVNAVHPGTVNTRFGRDFGGMWRILFAFFKPFMRPVEKGAETVIWLATSPELEGISGKYFYDKKEIRSKEISYDREAAKKLWEMSEKMTGSMAGVKEK